LIDMRLYEDRKLYVLHQRGAGLTSDVRCTDIP
jgi:hypothetical protein